MKNSRIRFYGAPFSGNEIELYLGGECSKKTKAAIEHYIEANSDFKEYLQNYRNDTFSVPLTNVIERSKRGVTQKCTKNKIQIFGVLADWVQQRMTSPQIKVAFSTALFMVIGITITMSTLKKYPSNEVFAKGTSKIELLLNNHVVENAYSNPVHNNDTLQFQYRSVSDIHVIVLYQDDGGAIQSYIDFEGQSVLWQLSLNWKRGSKKVVFWDDFTDEIIWVITSIERFSKSEAIETIGNNTQFEKLIVKNQKLENLHFGVKFIVGLRTFLKY